MNNNIRRVFIRPEGGDSFSDQLSSCLEVIHKNHDSGISGGIILQISFFVQAFSNKEYIAYREEISLSMNQMFLSSPSFSVIAQPPADELIISVELTVLENKGDDTRVFFKNMNGTPYTVVESIQGKEVYAAGISGQHPEDKLSVQVEEAYKLMKDILSAESLQFSDIVRQWNYVENIVHVHHEGDKPIQNYQVLNDIRSVYYSEAEFNYGYPAATGIGMNFGGILLELYAVKPLNKVDIVPVKNPNQVDAYSYSQEVLIGDSIKKLPEKTTPKFERAKYISFNGHKIVFISGTASIHNEKTIGIGDIEKQTQVTLENISDLVTTSNLKSSGAKNINGELNYSFLRIYVKKSSDLKIVKNICDSKFSNVSISYLMADICRDDLLVEIEGVAEYL